MVVSCEVINGMLLNEAELQNVFDDLLMRSDKASELREYVTLVKESQSVGVCAKCNYTTGCEKCNHVHSLRYAIKHEQPASWFYKARGKALSACTGNE